MKYPVWKKVFAVITTVAVAILPLSATVLASDISQTAEPEPEDGGTVSGTALAYYDFKDFAPSDNTLTDGERTILLEKQGSGTEPSLVEDDVEYGRGQVLQLNSASYANRGYALLPANPFEGESVDDGLTLNFWTKTNETQSNYGNRCLIDFEVAPATSGRAGTFAVNQSMIYWNTTDQNSKYMDFSTGKLGLSMQNVWKMVTVALTTNGLTVYCDGNKIETSITVQYSTDYDQMIRDLAGGLLGSGQTSNVRLGASLATYWSCAGAMLDDVSFYGKALTDEEVKTLYNETKVKIDVTGITISADGGTSIEEGKTVQLNVSFTPSNTTEKNLVWTSYNEDVLTVDENGMVTGVGEGRTTVTASVGNIISNAIEIIVSASVKSLDTGYYLTVYSTSTDYYATAWNVEQETHSVYMAVSSDGQNFTVLNNGGGVIFSKNSSGTLMIANPKIFRTKNGFTVVAPDAAASKGIHLFTSMDGVNYYDDTIVESTELDAASLKKDNFTLMLKGKNILETDQNITLGNAVSLTEEEYTYFVNKLGNVTNNGLETLNNLSTDTKTGLTESKLAKLYPSVNATYTDGSVQNFTIDWTGALANANLTKAGSYTLTGTVVQTKYLNNLKELNKSTLPEDDPENTSNDPDNYNEESGTTYYDATKFVEGMADPYIYWDVQTGYYYMTGSYFPEEGDKIDANDNLQQYDRIVLRRARTLEGLQDRSAQVSIWKVQNQGYTNSENAFIGSGYRYIWAPEIHRVGNNWVIYFTESHSSLFNIYCHALVLPGDQDPYETALKSSDQVSAWTDYQVRQNHGINDGYNSLATNFCLDMTYFKDEVNGQSYVIWAGKPTSSYEGSSTDLFIAVVDESQPWVVTSAATRLTCSEYGWERIRYCVNEGATVLQKDGNIFMCYSASGTGSEYAIGMCSAKGGENLLDISQWTKSPYPLLTSRDVDGEEGPGHNSFTVDKEGNAIFVYHARPTSHNYQKCGSDADGNNSTYNGEALNDPCRHARLKRVHWAADGTPILKMTYEDELLKDFSTVFLTLTVTEASEEPSTSEDSKQTEKVTIRYQAGTGGIIQGTATQTVEKGSKTSTVKAVAKTGYTFVKWSDGMGKTSRTDTAASNRTYTATFVRVVTKVKLNRTKLTLGVKETFKLVATPQPSSAVSKKITFSSGKKSVAVVGSSGKITAKKVGKTTITAKAPSGVKATCTVTVKKAPSKITLNRTNKTLKKGKKFQIKVTLPKNTASNKTTYTSNKKAIATVSSTGKVTAKKKGTATITVKTFNGKRARIKITVK